MLVLRQTLQICNNAWQHPPYDGIRILGSSHNGRLHPGICGFAQFSNVCYSSKRPVSSKQLYARVLTNFGSSLHVMCINAANVRVVLWLTWRIPSGVCVFVARDCNYWVDDYVFCLFHPACKIRGGQCILAIFALGLNDSGPLRAIVEFFVPRPCQMKGNIFKRGLLRIISNCTGDPLSAVKVLAQAEKLAGRCLIVLDGLCMIFWKQH